MKNVAKQKGRKRKATTPFSKWPLGREKDESWARGERAPPSPFKIEKGKKRKKSGEEEEGG